MERRFSGSLIVAGAAHIGLLVAAMRAPQPSFTPRTPAPTEVEVTFESATPMPAPAEHPAASSTDTESKPPANDGVVAPPHAAGAVASRVPAAPGSGSGTDLEPDEVGASGEEVSPSGPRRPIDLGLGGAIPLWMRERAGERPKAPGKMAQGSRTAGGLAQGLAEGDRARGVGRGGVVASTTRQAALAKGPRNGKATFIVTTDRDGRVTSVSIADVSADASLWSEVAAFLRSALSGKRLRVPPGANGLRVAVRVESRIQMPSGAAPGKSVEMQGPGAQFDVSDIGARPTRVVSCRILSEAVL